MTKTEKAQKRLDEANAALEAAQQRVETARAAFEAARTKDALSKATDEQLDAELDATLAEREVSDAQTELERERTAELSAEFEAMLPQCDVDAIAAPFVDRLVALYAELAVIHDEAMVALRKLPAAHQAARALLGRGARGYLPELKVGEPRKFLMKAVKARVDVDERADLLPSLDGMSRPFGHPYLRAPQLRAAE